MKAENKSLKVPNKLKAVLQKMLQSETTGAVWGKRVSTQ